MNKREIVKKLLDSPSVLDFCKSKYSELLVCAGAKKIRFHCYVNVFPKLCYIDGSFNTSFRYNISPNKPSDRYLMLSKEEALDNIEKSCYYDDHADESPYTLRLDFALGQMDSDEEQESEICRSYLNMYLAKDGRLFCINGGSTRSDADFYHKNTLENDSVLRYYGSNGERVACVKIMANKISE